MSTETKFIVISHDEKQIRNLKDYIEDLYNRDYTSDKHMSGYGMKILHCKTVYMLVGCHKNCSGYTLDYWSTLENKNGLLKHTVYLEEDLGILKWYESGPYHEPLSIITNFFDCEDLEVEDIASIFDITYEQADIVHTYFIKTAMWSLISVKYEVQA